MPQFLSNGVVTVINGVFAALDTLFSPFAFAAVAAAVALAWVCRVEIAELDRQGSKPFVKRH